MVTFRTKARAIDHLGKGQIADLPTAITELWKNGYDAYADNVRCELYQKGVKGLKQSVFILADDGFGMEQKDILEKWVVLGTDSKARGEMSLSSEERLGKPYRIPLGEKGIGRLSVAYLGTPMLLITKKINKNAKLLLADWRILENYNLYLEDIDFPIRTLVEKHSDKKEFDRKFRKIKNKFRENFDYSDWDEHVELKSDILKDLRTLTIPDLIFEREITPFLDLEYHGTSFIIFQPHPQLLELGIDGAVWDSEASSSLNYLRSSLNGLTNLFREKNDLEIDASFNLHHKKGSYDIISRTDFFSRDDIFSVDHWLSGKFNEFGEFNGELKVFNQVHKVFFRANRPPGKTPYGPFPIEFGFLEGNSSNSKLNREQWDEYWKKLKVYGGLYIYRDGFRVLPYGRAEYDFLRFEERRSKSATYYQFSHRRIFGYIGLTRESNPSLKDKAGREGFIVNKAYRAFVDDLIEFFTDLSVRYFRTNTAGEEPTSRQSQVEEINARNKRILAAEKKKNKTTTRNFSKDLENNLSKVKLLEVESTELYSRIEAESLKDRIRFNVIQNLIDEIRENQIRLRELNLIKPQRITLSKSLKDKYSDYRDKIDRAKEAIDSCNELIGDLQTYLTEEEFKNEFSKRMESYSKSLKNKLNGYRKRLSNAMNPILEEIGSEISSVSSELSFDTSAVSQNHNNEDQGQHQVILRNLDLLFDDYAENIDKKYGPIANHVEGLDLNIDDDALVGWYKEQHQLITEKVEAMHELAQLGMAIEIIDHQFNVLYAEVAQSLSFFKNLSQKNDNAREPFKQLQNAFQHLETNHKLLTPLYRTTRRSRVEISGLELKNYLADFFSSRFEKHRISFETNEAFDDYIFFTFESVLKPAFINIINNAIYWLRSVDDKKIKILYENDVFLLLNSGKKIGREFLEDIFKLFFSRRPGGRGIGLYLAQTNLRTIGFDIYATEERKFNKLNGACFVIVPPKEMDDEF